MSDFAETIVSTISFEERSVLVDHFGLLPLTIRDFEVRLREGQSFTIEGQGSDGMSFSLWFQEDRFFLRQGKTLHPFRQVEPAVTTLLNCQGDCGKPGQ